MKTWCPSTLTVMGSWNPDTPPGIPLQRQVQSTFLRRARLQAALPPLSNACLVPAVSTVLCQTSGLFYSLPLCPLLPVEQVNQDVSRQLLQDGYHLDEIPDDEDLDLIPPKPMASSACSCCWCCLGDSSSCTLQ
ncbi:protein FAM219B isoform X5 [Macaca fascicularis]|uniref:protein FAM219B isoform X5 n=1 Tax=Macaca fascicularis TaxID=9541 RepID=UPI003D158795